MDRTTIIVIAAIMGMLLLFLWLVRGRRQHVAFDAATPLPRTTATPATSAPAPAPTPVATEEGHGLGSEVSAAVEDVVDQFMGIDAHPSGSEPGAGAGDTLTLLKGLGPRAAARLQELGVTRFDQIAAWNEGDVAAIDEQMGAFKGRIARDRWIDQARLLAAGDEAGFEQTFGRLGG